MSKLAVSAVLVKDLYGSIIIGSGGAGLSCALELQETKVSYLMLERAPRLAAGLNQIAGRLPNFLGGYFETGEQLRARAVELAERLGLNYLTGCEVSRIDLKAMTVSCGDRQFRSKTIVLASGYRKRKLLPEQQPLNGVRYEVDGDGGLLAGRTVIVAGAGDNGLMDAIQLSAHCSIVYVVQHNRSLKARPDLIADAEGKPNITFLLDSKISILHGTGGLEAVTVVNLGDGSERHIETRDLIVRIGYEPNTGVVRDQVDMDSSGHILIAADCSTSASGFFAAGDITNPGYPRLATAVGHGMIAAGAVRTFLQRCETLRNDIGSTTWPGRL